MNYNWVVGQGSDDVIVKERVFIGCFSELPGDGRGVRILPHVLSAAPRGCGFVRASGFLKRFWNVLSNLPPQPTRQNAPFQDKPAGEEQTEEL